MKHLILSLIAAVTLLIAATTMLWSHSPSTVRHAAATVIGHCKNFHRARHSIRADPTCYVLLSTTSARAGSAICLIGHLPISGCV